MAQDYFVSARSPDATVFSAPGVSGAGSGTGTINSGTSTLTTDAFEFRVSTGVTGYLTPSKQDVRAFMEIVERWLTDADGLDALLLANSATVGIP